MKCGEFAGKAKHRITIQSRSEATDVYGGSDTTWATQSTVWADITPLSGREVYQQEQKQSRVSSKMLIRYQSALKNTVTTAKFRVSYDGRIFPVDYIRNLDSDMKSEGNVYQELFLTEAEPENNQSTTPNPQDNPFNSFAIIAAGQSNAQYLYTYGRTQYEAIMDQYWADADNTLIDGATSGSTLIFSNATDDNWWYNELNDTYGDAWDTFEAVVSSYTGTILGVHWDQGENDQGDIANNPTKQAIYKNGLVTVFERMREIIGADIPVFICPIGRRGDAQTGIGYQVLREIQKQLADEYTWIHLLPEKFTQGDDGGAHLNIPAGYQAYAPFAARKALSVLGETISGVDGAQLVSASRGGTTINVLIDHDAGTDYTPIDDINGFKLFDDGSEIEVLNAFRIDSTHIGIDIASVPTGASQVLYYGYDRLNDVDNTKLLKDNSSFLVPFKSTTITSIPVSETYLNDIVAGAVWQHDARLRSYNGEQLIPNLIPVPNDGQTQTTYNGSLGSSVAETSIDPGFSVDHWTFDGDDYNRVGGTSPTAFHAGLSTDKSFTFICHFKTPSTLSGQPQLFSCGGTASSVAGITLRYIASSNFMRIATANGTTSTTSSMSTASQLTGNTVYKMAFALNPSTGAYTLWLNSATPVLTGTASLGGATSTSPLAVFNQFTASTELYGYAMYDSVLNNTDIQDIFDYYGGL